MAVYGAEILQKVPEKDSVVSYSVYIVSVMFFYPLPKILHYPTSSLAVSNISHSLHRAAIPVKFPLYKVKLVPVTVRHPTETKVVKNQKGFLFCF